MELFPGREISVLPALRFGKPQPEFYGIPDPDQQRYRKLIRRKYGLMRSVIALIFAQMEALMILLPAVLLPQVRFLRIEVSQGNYGQIYKKSRKNREILTVLWIDLQRENSNPACQECCN